MIDQPMVSRIDSLLAMKRELEALGCTVTITAAESENTLTVEILVPDEKQITHDNKP